MILNHRMLAAAAIVMFGFTPAVFAQHGQTSAPPGQAQSLQGGDNSAWTNNPHMHAFYDLTVATLGKGAPPVNLADYQERSYAIFRAFGTSMGGTPEGMVDHLKDIPRQMVGIAKDDPKVLDSYRNFTLALMGPE